MNNTTATLFAFCGMVLLVSLFLAFIVLWGKRAERRAAKSDAPETAPPTPSRVVSRPIGEAAPTMRDTIGGRIMSILLGSGGAIEGVADRLPATLPEAGQGFATPGNAVNDRLPGQPVAAPAVPDDARDIIKFWANVEAVEAIVRTGKIGQVEAIETIFGCKRSGRPESVYGRAVAAVKAREQPRYAIPLTPEQVAARADLGLEG